MIKFTHKDIDFKLTHQKDLKLWIANVISSHSLSVGDIVYLFTNDDEVLQVNKEFLGHDYYTDIITFDTSDYFDKKSINNKISADIVISIDTVKANALEYNASFEEELYRVIIHGILHLIGFDDHSEEDISQMREQENLALNSLRDIIGDF